ncbi:MAG: sensor histidine kinase [Alphaproteobacteria bacterium]|nr:sensor histidine kinase [Alphaproteobacteria bacterium]
MDTTLRQPKFESLPAQDPAAEAHHRIANSLTLLVSMVRMKATSIARQPDPPSTAEVRLLLDGIGARINTIAHLHRLLSHAPFEGETELLPHLKEVTDALVSALASPEQQVQVIHSGQGAMVRTRQVQPLVLILCEVFINAMKYARPDGGQVILCVECGPGVDGRLRVSVSDNGGGLPDGLDPRTASGLGFRVMRSLAAEIDAELHFESSPRGFGVHLALPVRRN